MMRLAILLLCLAAAPALADPERYRLDAARSTVGFSYTFNGAAKAGQMPVKAAEILIDVHDVTASEVSVTLDARNARAGFIFATQAMNSPQVLHTAKYPTIHFRSTRISGTLSGATVTGNLTVRGVTRPVALTARLYRQRDTNPNDLNDLAILLTGAISRSAFGATGYPNDVGDQIGLRIIARVVK